MKLVISKDQLSSSPEQFLKRASYAYIYDRKTRKESFTLRLGHDHYPRLHMYVSEGGESITFDLHLDQKKPSYAGSNAHSAEYDGELVSNEIARLKELVSKETKEPVANEVSKTEKKCFLSKIFSFFRK
ncbi:hypothetical protein ISS03_04550 [Patescibacteria group bacterium]|nr:hypothetical protein [Patescibacteria group bacterium]